MEVSFPLKGKNVGAPGSKQPSGTSRDLNNVRPRFDGRYIGGQRDGLDKLYSQQIGGSDDGAVVFMCSVTVVD